MKITEINGQTGEVTQRSFTKDELAQQLLDEQVNAVIASDKIAKTEAKALAQAKLAALGLTVEDLQALGL